MTFEIIVGLVVILFITAIFFNAMQQHREKVDSEKRQVTNKHKGLIEETEELLITCEDIPVTQHMIKILQLRMLHSLQQMLEMNPQSKDLKKRIKEQKRICEETEASDKMSAKDFHLPDTDKLIIKYIQGVKRLRAVLRSEHNQGKVDSKLFIQQDRLLENVQVKVNVETLGRRASAAMNGNMLGSARQYLEKAIKALRAQSSQDEYSKSRMAHFQTQLEDIQNKLKSSNAQDRAKKIEDERDELDELFSQKKKW